MKYFFGENAHRPFKAGGRNYGLEVVGTFGGTAQGVLAVEDGEAAAILAEAGRFVREISQEEYEAARAKKKRTRGSSPSRPSQPPRAPGAVSSIKQGAHGVGVARPAASVPGAATDSLPVSALEAVKVDRIAADAPQPAGEAPARPARRASRRTSANAQTVASPDATEAGEPAI